MANIERVEDVLNSIKTDKGGRFNKKSFIRLMKAMANDTTFTQKVVKVKNSEVSEVNEIMVSNEFRKFIQKILEAAGVDKNESIRCLSEDFAINSVDGLYEFFATCLYKYIEAGNSFDLLPVNGFKGSIGLKHVGETEKTADAFSPKDRSYIGTFTTTKGAHNVLTVKSGCPSYLKSRKKVEK